jgi:uncharacterized protein
MHLTFPISGVQTYFWLPPLTAFCISFFTSMAGISGAFLLLPFQISVLGFHSPAVSSTNLIFNIVATPGGIWRFLREKRLLWPLAWTIIAGTLPGVVIGGFIRLHWLPNPNHFKVFAGCLLLYIALRLIAGARYEYRARDPKTQNRHDRDFNIEILNASWPKLSYRFQEQDYHCGFLSLFSLSFIVGILGSIYGIGGGALIAPFLISVYRLPIHTVAGATLMSTFATSIAGVAFYELASLYYPAANISPDWLLGFLFGIGGLCGAYLGARAQRYIPAIWLKSFLALVVLYVATTYLMTLRHI